MKILLSGGGTSGHINPAIAIANYVSEIDKNAEFIFVGSHRGYENTLVPRSGYKIKFIDVEGFRRKKLLGNIIVLLKIAKSLLQSKKILKAFNPGVVIGTGGYVCGPVLYMAHLLRIPTIIHECNVFPGLTTKLLSKQVDVISLAFDKTKQHLSQNKKIKDKLKVVGNPIRPSILNCDVEKARKKLGFDTRPLVVVFGGSLGAKHFNDVVVQWLVKVFKEKNLQVLVAAGKNNYYYGMLSALKAHGVCECGDIKIMEYIYDMGAALNCASLVIARAGAGTISELMAVGKPSILVPSPYVTNNHQQFNAELLEEIGGAKVILEKDLNSDILKSTVDSILDNKMIAKKMAKSAKNINITNACNKIYQIMLELTKEKSLVK